MKGSTNGIAILELTIVAAMTILLFAALFSFYWMQLIALRTQEAKVELKEQADVGLDFLIKEVRLAGARPVSFPGAGCSVPLGPTVASLAPCTGFERVTSAGPQTITIQYDYRGSATTDPPDGCPDDPGEQIRFTRETNGTITRTLGTAASQILTANVASAGFLLTYRNAAGNVLSPTNGALSAAQRAAIATIEMTLEPSVASPHARVPGPLRTRRTTTIFIRNPRC